MNNIKKIAKFLYAKSDYFDKACVMCEAPNKIKMKIAEIANSIPKEILNFDEGGIEDQVHITVIFGVNDDIDFGKYFNKPLEIVTDDKITYFECDGFDVAKIDVFSDELRDIHYAMKENEENTHSYDYHPHLTVAYLNKGERLKDIKFPKYKWLQKEMHNARNGLLGKKIL